MTAKSTKATAHYRDGSDERRCALCTMFRPPGSCTAVSGEISADGLCDYFERKSKKRAWYRKEN